jgi:prepilin-type N-terminal cleavage/methylation domain-containing protein
MKKRGFTLIELLVVIAIIAMLLAILMPALSKVKKIAQRVVCGTNLKGLGTAQTVYAHDYNDQYTVQGRGTAHIWNDRTAAWENSPATPKNWATAANLSVGASLYLLVREADVSPKSFVCPASAEREYSGRNPNNIDIVELYDFGNPNWTPPTGSAEGPAVCVSYAYHKPYAAAGGKSPMAADGNRSASFAVMADKSPYMDPKTTQWDYTGQTTMSNTVARVGEYYTAGLGLSKSSPEVKVSNSHPHDRDGQNVLYADGHNSYENTPDVGVMNDGIYTVRGGAGDVNIQQIRGGQHNANSVFKDAPGTARNNVGPNVVSKDDSFLVNDSHGGW